jgi:hypothetical protein
MKGISALPLRFAEQSGNVLAHVQMKGLGCAVPFALAKETADVLPAMQVKGSCVVPFTIERRLLMWLCMGRSEALGAVPFTLLKEIADVALYGQVRSSWCGAVHTSKGSC